MGGGAKCVGLLSTLEVGRGEEDRCSNELHTVPRGERQEKTFVPRAVCYHHRDVRPSFRTTLLRDHSLSQRIRNSRFLRRSFLSGLVLLLAWNSSLFPQDAQRLLIPVGEPPIEETQIANMLRNQPAKDYEFDRAVLRDVLRFLARDAGISFVSVPEVGETESRLVTFDLRASPFRALEIVAKSNGVALSYEDGVWYLRPQNDRELIGRTYKLKFNTQETVEYDGGASTAPMASTSGMGGTQSGSGTTPDLGLSLTGQADVFKLDPKQLIDDIKALLGIPTTAFDGVIAEEVAVDTLNPLGPGTGNLPTSLIPDGGGQTAAGDVGGPQVIWNSDSNTLYIVATRQQHKWVEGYLASVDRPQALIAIEVKFFETTKDPRKQLGVDWEGTLGDGFTVAARAIRVAPNGTITIDQENSHQSQSGAFPPEEYPYDYRSGRKATTATFGAPYSAILSTSDVATTLRAFLDDRDTTTVSYPRVLTRNNREVVIRSVMNEPVLAATSSVTPGVGGTTTASVTYLPIGTIINVLPKTMDDGSVLMNLAVTVSSIVGEKAIDGNSYPIASTRVYNAALEVNSGYTIAIGGIDEAFDSSRRDGIPLLKDIPLLGAAFRSSNQLRRKKNLILFITPTVLGHRPHTGISETPQSTLPVRPGEPPTPPAFSPDGMLVGGEGALPGALAWLAWQERFFREIIRERRASRETVERIEGLIATCQLLLVQTETLRAQGSANPARLEEAQAELDRIIAACQKLRKDARDTLIGFSSN